MKSYRVTWSIDLDAESPKTAAEAALRMQRDETSIATFFEVAELDRRGMPSKYITPIDLGN